MFKLVTMYRRVDAQNKIDEFFSHTHLPLAEQLPHLIRTEVSHIKGKPQGESRFYMSYELYFASQKMCLAALNSEAGQALLTALEPWEKARVISWFYAEVFAADMAAS